jgi:hypothetical protein
VIFGLAVVVFGLAVVVFVASVVSDGLGTIIEGFTSRGLSGGCIAGFAVTVAVFTAVVSVFGTEVFVLVATVESAVGAAGETGEVVLAITTPAQR